MASFTIPPDTSVPFVQTVITDIHGRIIFRGTSVYITVTRIRMIHSCEMYLPNAPMAPTEGDEDVGCHYKISH
ncbi:unnamed protein product [Clonostachys rosea f. rosea IK726]|uniref:Uncharacterized protein n=1 Tax=Clonostachys rosea f. rosea IK726 TaxID=1349383 RepID=A0ACA9TT44_BIOOC|nr:unnamed protein product [Clonostachys rosea f. rosea IK726]